jgi:hypothetical protein
LFDEPKPQGHSKVPFQEFGRLSRGGNVWKADPAGWHLGISELMADESLEPIKAKSPARDKPLTKDKSPTKAKFSATAVPTSNKRKGSRPSMPSFIPPPALIGSHRFPQCAVDSDSSDDDADDDCSSDESDQSCDYGFEEMSIYKWYRIKGSPTTALRSIGGDSDDEEQNSASSDSDSEAGRSSKTSNDSCNEEQDLTLSDSDSEAGRLSTKFDDSGDEEQDSTLLDSDSKAGRTFKKSRKARKNFEMDSIPRREMVTKKIDSMGELNER